MWSRLKSDWVGVEPLWIVLRCVSPSSPYVLLFVVVIIVFRSVTFTSCIHSRWMFGERTNGAIFRSRTDLISLLISLVLLRTLFQNTYICRNPPRTFDLLQHRSVFLRQSDFLVICSWPTNIEQCKLRFSRPSARCLEKFQYSSAVENSKPVYNVIIMMTLWQSASVGCEGTSSWAHAPSQAAAARWSIDIRAESTRPLIQWKWDIFIIRLRVRYVTSALAM